MKRAVGTILFGLGVLFAVLAIGLRLYVAPAVTKLPYDLGESKSLVEAKNATYLHVSSQGAVIKTGNLLSTTIVKPQPVRTQELQKEFKNQAVLWNVYSTTTDPNGDKISESATEIALDRVSGAPIDWSGAWYNDGTKTSKRFKGQIYKFPFHTERKDYPYWDNELADKAPLARFEGVETLNGVEVYRFKQTIDWTRATSVSSDRVNALAGVFGKGAKTGEMWYSNTRTFWVEPVTGQFIDLREQRKQELRFEGGKETLLNADFRYTKETVDASITRANENRFLIQAVSLYGPLALGLLAVVLIVIGTIMATKRPRYAPGHRDL